MKSNEIVAIDGPSGAGKSTLARRLAQKLNYIYIDTGAMYRAVALRAKREGLTVKDDEAIGRMTAEVDVRFTLQEGQLRTILDDEDVSELIRTPEISMAASAFSAHPLVRSALTRLQRKMGRAGKVVMEGRDIGTAVFPEASHKFFPTAPDEVRAKRRLLELRGRGDDRSTLEEVLADMRKRDADDSSRLHAPLIKPPDAVEIDTSEMTIDEVTDFCLRWIRDMRDVD